MKKWFCRRRKDVLLTICLLLSVGLLTQLSGIKAEAAEEYVELWDSSGNDAAIKNGDYYFKYDASSGKLFMLSNKDDGYRKTPMGYGAFGDGTQAYYVRNNVLYRYVYAEKQEERLKKLPVSGDENFRISTVYGKQVFLTKSSFDQWAYWTYSYNTKTGKLKKVMSDCYITDRHKKYVVGENAYRTDVGPYPVTVYKITASGLKKIKKLSSYGRSETFVDGKLYYTDYEPGSMQKATLYRCNPNGSGRKKLAVFSSKNEYDGVIVLKIAAKSCVVYRQGGQYRYTYATKKMKKIK